MIGGRSALPESVRSMGEYMSGFWGPEVDPESKLAWGHLRSYARGWPRNLRLEQREAEDLLDF